MICPQCVGGRYHVVLCPRCGGTEWVECGCGLVTCFECNPGTHAVRLITTAIELDAVRSFVAARELALRGKTMICPDCGNGKFEEVHECARCAGCGVVPADRTTFTDPATDLDRNPVDAGHYQHHNHQAIDVIADWLTHYPPRYGWQLGHVLRYIARAPFKGMLVRDLEKAADYLQRAIDHARDD